MTLYFHDENVYDGLISLIGRGHISNFIENLVRPIVTKTLTSNEILKGYKMMAEDKEREKEAHDWINGCIGDVAHESW